MKKVLFILMGMFFIFTGMGEKIYANTTDMIFILDRSGSMSGLESDTIGGFNSTIEKQKKEEGEVFVTTILFDNKIELLHNRVNIKDIKNMTDKEYYVRGSTALLDAIGDGISLEKTAQITAEKEGKAKADKVIFVIITDGMENASKEYNYEAIKNMINTQKEKNKWEFLFLGANIDAVSVAKSIGIAPMNAVQYISDSAGTKENYRAVNKAMTQFRSSGAISEDWKKEVELDYQKRSNK